MKKLWTVTMFGLSLALLFPSPTIAHAAHATDQNQPRPAKMANFSIANADASKAFADIENGVKKKKTSGPADKSDQLKKEYLAEKEKESGGRKK